MVKTLAQLNTEIANLQRLAQNDPAYTQDEYWKRTFSDAVAERQKLGTTSIAHITVTAPKAPNKSQLSAPIDTPYFTTSATAYADGTSPQPTTPAGAKLSAGVLVVAVLILFLLWFLFLRK